MLWQVPKESSIKILEGFHAGCLKVLTEKKLMVGMKTSNVKSPTFQVGCGFVNFSPNNLLLGFSMLS